MDEFLDGRSLDELKNMRASLQRGVTQAQSGRDTMGVATAVAAGLGAGAPIAVPGAIMTGGLWGLKTFLNNQLDHVNQRIEDQYGDSNKP